MKSILSATALVLFAFMTSSSWAANKCIAANGSVTFQETPCEGKPASKLATPPTSSSKTAASKPRPPIGDPAYENARESERSKHINDYAKTSGAALAADIQASEAKCGKGSLEPHIGATSQWIRKCSWGEPSSVRTIENSLGKSDQWRYKAKGTLYFDATGKVTTILN